VSRKSSRSNGLEVRDLGSAGDLGATSHYVDPAYYDVAYRKRSEDVEYYTRLAKRAGGPVLEYGVGNGRIAIVAARAGVSITGVDLSVRMLSSLREKLSKEAVEVRKRVRVVHGDMRRARLRGRFALVIAPFNTVLHLYTRADVERFLARVRAHLVRRGRFVFDCAVPSPEDLGADPARAYGAPRFRHPVAGLVRYRERFEYDPIRQVLLVHMDFHPENGSPAWSVPLTHRQFFPQELEALLHYNGFGDIRFTSDFSDRPATSATDSLLVSCRARS
jgi:SAM-dependent methyltransferase